MEGIKFNTLTTNCGKGIFQYSKEQFRINNFLLEKDTWFYSDRYENEAKGSIEDYGGYEYLEALLVNLRTIFTLFPETVEQFNKQ